VKYCNVRSNICSQNFWGKINKFIFVAEKILRGRLEVLRCSIIIIIIIN